VVFFPMLIDSNAASRCCAQSVENSQAGSRVEPEQTALAIQSPLAESGRLSETYADECSFLILERMLLSPRPC